MNQQIKDYITKLEWRAMIRTVEVIDFLKTLIKEEPKQEDTTLLQDVQELYLKKYGNIPARYKNDITRLSSKL